MGRVNKDEDLRAAEKLINYLDFGVARTNVEVYFWKPLPSELAIARTLIADVDNKVYTGAGLKDNTGFFYLDTAFQQAFLGILNEFKVLGAISSYQEVTSPYTITGGLVDMAVGITYLPGGINSAGKQVRTDGVTLMGVEQGPNMDSDWETPIMLHSQLPLDLRDSTIRHEIGHAIGLRHPSEVGLEAKYDSYRYTMMSYNGLNDLVDVEPEGLMMLDYLALSTNELLSNNLFAESGSSWYWTKPTIATIYDTGGEHDVISAKTVNVGSIIDLRSGHFSSYGAGTKGNTALENIGIFWDSTIEDAIGSDYDDVLIGNDYNNELKGGDGDDFIYGSGEKYETTDWKFSQAHKDAYSVNVDASTKSTNDNDTLYGGDDDDHLYGLSGRDTLYGDMGDDSIDGGTESDHIYGDYKQFSVVGGKDTIDGGEGDDTLEGGEGDDEYTFTGNFGNDVIIDKNGKIVVGGHTLGTFYKSRSSSEYKIGSSLTATRVGSSLLISASSPAASTGTIEIRNWAQGDLGITLTKAQPLPDVEPPPVPAAPRVDPLSIDLNANGAVDTLPITAGIHFDLDNNGFAERTSWVAPTDGILVLDRNSNNKIDGGAELFGTETKLNDGTFAQNGFVALAEFDLNKDGKINSQDAIYTQLRVWKDANSNGITDSGELLTLAATDIASLSVTYTSNTTTDANNVQHREEGTFTRSGGTTGITNTLWFESDKQATIPVEELNGDGIPLTAEIEALPDAKGFGNIYSLRQAMSLDSSGLLQQKVQAFANETDIATRKTLVNDILILWAGQQNTAADSRGANIDAKQLGVLETFWGQPAQQANPMGLYAVDLKNVYQQLSMSIYAQMASYQQAEVLSTINWSTTNGVLTADFSSAAAYFSNLFNQNDVSATFKLKDFLEIIKGAEPYNSANSVNSAAFSEALHLTSGAMSSPAFLSMASVFYSQPSGLIGTATSDILRGTDANNVMSGLEGHDVIVGGRGNDTLSGGSGNDVYLFSRGDGNDIITEHSGKDAIKFDAGILESDVKIHRTFVDIVITLNTGESISVNNMISSSSGAITANAIESIQFANGSVWDLHRIKQEAVRGSDLADVLYGFDTNDVISSGAGNDQIIDYVGDNTFAGGQGNDTLSGGNSNDIYLFSRGDGNDFINDSFGNDVIKFGVGILENDVRILRTPDNFMVTLNTGESITVNNMVNLSGFNDGAIENIQFSNGVVWDSYRIKQEAVKGTSAADLLYGFETDDLLIGGQGNDVLFDPAGNNTFIGGQGNDTITGYRDNDTYQFNFGDGIDNLLEHGGIDTVQFGEGVTKDNMSIRRNGYNLDFILSSGEKISALSMFDSLSGRLIPDQTIEQVKFSDGTVWDLMRTKQEAVTGSSGSDALYGFDSNDVIKGGKGNDALLGADGDDVYVYNKGDGIDIINDTSGKNEIQFGSGISESDLIVRFNPDRGFVVSIDAASAISGNSLDSISFANGTVWDKARLIVEGLKPSNANDVLYGSSFNDILSAGIGEDTLLGLAGDDTYLISRGDFNLLQIEDSSGSNDIIQLSEGIQLSDLTLEIGPNNELIMSLFSGESINIKNGAMANQAIESVRFYNGETLTQAQLISMASAYNKPDINKVIGTSANDILRGVSWKDSLEGGAGNDSLYGGTGSDTLLGGLNDDILFGAAGGDKLDGGDGNDVLNGGYDFDSLIGGNGNDILISNDRWDSIHDILQGGLGDDKYIISSGIISDSGGNDTLILPDSITPDNLYLTFEIDYYTSKDTINFRTRPTPSNVYGDFYISIDAWDYKNSALVTSRWIETIQFANGIVWNTEDFRAFLLKGTSANDYQIGTDADNLLEGTLGNDNLEGGKGNDTYTYKAGDGNDRIFDISGNDRLELIGLIESDIVSVRRSLYSPDQDDITIKFASGQILIPKQFGIKDQYGVAYPASIGLENIYFSNGVVWDSNLLKAAAVKGTAENDLIPGFNINEVIDGGLGSDTIYGSGGEDTLIGGAGNDYLLGDEGSLFNGGVGDDSIQSSFINGKASIVQYARGDGKDTLSGAGNSIIKLGAGIDISDVVFTRIDNDLLINFGQGDQILSRTIFNTNSTKVNLSNLPSSLEFANSTTTNLLEYLNGLGYNTTPPKIHSVEINLSGTVISGIADPSTYIYTNGNYKVRADAQTGVFSITLSPALINKESIIITGTDEFARKSVGVTIVAPDLTAPTTPTASFDIAGKVITGVAEVGSTVEVKNSGNTATLGTIVADVTTGAYTITLNTALINKETVNVTAKDAAGNVSAVKAIIAPDKTPPALPTAVFDTAGKVITGVAEAGSTVVVKNSTNTTTLGTVTANATTGAYSITIPTALINKEVVNVTAKDAAGNTSAPLSINAPDKVAPAQPTAAFDTIGAIISGVAEAGSTVIVKNSGNTTTLGTATANATTGAYTITLTTALINKETVNVTAKDAAGNTSTAKVIVAPDKTAPALPTAAFDTAGKVITGVAEAGSTVEVKNSGNTATLGTATANATTGAYTITLTTALINKETVNVTAKDAAGNVSAVKAIIAPDKTAPALPTAAFDAAGKVITGVAEAGSTVEIKNSGNTATLGTATANATTGAYTITLVTALINKETVNVTAKDAAGNVSAVKAIIAPDKTAPALPTAAFDTVGKVITGVAEAGSTVEVKNSGNTTTLGTATANATTGAYTITLVTALINKETVNVTAKDVAGNVSAVKAIIAPDKTAPALPTAAFDTAGKVITGIAEAGSTVEVKNSGNTATLGTATANATTGAYTITLTTALINKETVNVTAKDVAGNVSAVKAIIAPDKTAPALPTAAFDTAGKVITGIAEAGSTVEVKNSGNTATLGTATANATTGAYTITLVAALINKETVNVTAKDVAGNVSTVKAIIAPDKTAPALPTAAFDTAGKVITGVAEAGSTVEVKNSGNTTTLGTVTAHATTGAYSVTLATALTNGQTVNVTAKDVAGNVSAAKAIIAPKLAAALASQSFMSQKSVDATHQLDSLIQAMAAFAPPSAAESKVLVGVYDMTQPILASQA